MPRDYAKKKKTRKKPSASRSNKKSSISKGFVFVTLILLCGLVALLVYLKFYSHDGNGSATSRSSLKTSQQKKPSKATHAKQQNKASSPSANKSTAKESVPFYKTHQEMMNKTVEIPIEDLKLPEDTHPYVYLMPCGSFRDQKRAEELKAQIALVGYESAINHVVVKTEDWYRVELGPYKSKRKTESIRHRLQDNGFNFCKIWPQRKK